MTGWGTPREVALYVGRTPATIRTWAARLAVPVACDLRTRRLVVHAGSTRAYADLAGARSTRQPVKMLSHDA